MFLLLRRPPRAPIFARHARAAYFSQSATQAVSATNATELADLENAPILRIVRRKLWTRRRLKAELSDDPSSAQDIARLQQLKQLEPLHDEWLEFTRRRQLLLETLPLLDDPDMRSLAEDDHAQLTAALTDAVRTRFPALLVSASPTAVLSALLELKSGVGGSESSLFLGDILRMYLRIAQSSGWSATVLARNDSEGGGVKDAVVELKGAGAYDRMKHESGVHRVQRIPATESGGRVHTSTVAVLVLPLSDEPERDGKDDLFDMADIKLEVMRARGAGGQHVNKTESAVRLTHVPTGISVSMQDERSQHQNKRRAFQVLRARLMDAKLIKDQADRRATRRNLVRTVDRSEKVRTYNYPQDRVTDHRLGLSLNNLTAVLEGEALGDLIDKLKAHHDQQVLEDMLEDMPDEGCPDAEALRQIFDLGEEDEGLSDSSSAYRSLN